MCLGIPMQVRTLDGGSAWCEGRGERRLVDTRLVDQLEVGSWVLVFHAVAREVLTEERARQVTDALRALDAALAGETNLDHLFPDLAGREPELPEHLRKELKRD